MTLAINDVIKKKKVLVFYNICNAIIIYMRRFLKLIYKLIQHIIRIRKNILKILDLH